MQNAFLSVLGDLAARAPRSDAEYLGEDGLMRCSYCHTPTECRISWGGVNSIVPCLCRCKEDERNRLAKLEEERRIYQARRLRCFEDPDMIGWTFANDDRANPRLSDAMREYAENFELYQKERKGLLLYGPVGPGKTYFAACIANALIDRGFVVRMANIATVIDRLYGNTENRYDILTTLNDCALLVLDDLGVESSTDYQQGVVYSIIDRRVRSGKPMIVTTNLSSEALKKPTDEHRRRVYDRILGACHPVEVTGPSRRKQALRESFGDMQNALGL